MCGRFAVTLPSDAMAQLFAASPANSLPEVPNYNVCPTDDVHVVWSESGERRLAAMRWGFVPHWSRSLNDGPPLINARAETIAEKPAFRAACRHRRCLIPASAYYEWTKDGQGRRLPWLIHPSGEDVLALAGIWQDWQSEGQTLRTCAIVTTSANDALSRIHHRMPVSLGRDDWPLWLGEAGPGAATLMVAPPEDALSFYRVSAAVNSNRAAGPELADPLDPGST